MEGAMSRYLYPLAIFALVLALLDLLLPLVGERLPVPFSLTTLAVVVLCLAHVIRP